MLTVDAVTAEVILALPAFGLEVRQVQAACLAALYVHHRPRHSAESVAEMFVQVPKLEWQSDEDGGTKLRLMRSLVEHLDMQYFVDTLEHDK